MKSDHDRLVPRGAPIRRYEGVVTVADQSAGREAATAAERIVVVERGLLRWVVFQCPCGCGELVTINLDKRVGPSWRLTRKKDSVSLNPSVWRESGCRSHFILWNNRVWMFRRWRSGDKEEDEMLPTEIDKELRLEWHRSRRRGRG